jgi:pimeloyl-ACP methyl ester carboxylesterase
VNSSPPYEDITLAELSKEARIDGDSVYFPRAHAPDRRRDLMVDGLRLAIHEWGDESNPPLLLAHGGFDFARTFDVFAPMLAAGDWRVISWDQRCHGDSDWAQLTSLSGDLRDAVAVLDSVTNTPLPIIGHSKGGAFSLRLAEALPHRFSHVVNIDGMPSQQRAPDIADHERSKLLSQDLQAWLDHRRDAAKKSRKPGTLEELARRRARMNPRLSHEWLCYLVTVGAFRSDDGWRWKIDPMMRMGGFGPWRPEWAINGLPGLSMPFLGFLAMEAEAMGWNSSAANLSRFIPRGGKLELMHDVGHFVHIERPGFVSARILEFLS